MLTSYVRIYSVPSNIVDTIDTYVPFRIFVMFLQTGCHIFVTVYVNIGWYVHKQVIRYA